MFCLKLSRIVIIVLLLNCRIATSQAAFSIDQASPEYPATYSSADIAATFGVPPPVIPAVNLGLLATDEIDAFSIGLDEIPPPPAPFFTIIYFSVTRPTVGVNGSSIRTESTGNGAAGDLFHVYMNTGWVWRLGPPTLISDATWHSLTQLPTQSDLDGHDYFVGAASPSYFSVICNAFRSSVARRSSFAGGSTTFNAGNPSIT